MSISGSIVVLRAGALGDTLLALPAIVALRGAMPDATVRVVGYPAFWKLAGSLVDEIHGVDDPRFAGLLSGTPSPALASWLRGTDLLVVWTQHHGTAGLGQTGVPRIVTASPYPPPSIHAAAWLLQTLSLPTDSLASFRLSLDLNDVEQAGQRLRSMDSPHPTIVHPGAGAAWKRWPAERFAALAHHLTRQGHQVVLLEGPADVDVIGQVQSHAATPYPVVREPSLRKLAAVLSHASLFIGNDSGTTHLAGVAGVPTVALFGPTDPVNWAPLGNSHVIRDCTARATRQGQIRVCDELGCMASLTVEVVVGEMRSVGWTYVQKSADSRRERR